MNIVLGYSPFVIAVALLILWIGVSVYLWRKGKQNLILVVALIYIGAIIAGIAVDKYFVLKESYLKTVIEYETNPVKACLLDDFGKLCNEKGMDPEIFCSLFENSKYCGANRDEVFKNCNDSLKVCLPSYSIVKTY